MVAIKNKLKLALLLMLIAVFALTACLGVTKTADGLHFDKDTTHLTLAVEKNLSSTSMEAINYFAEKVLEISDGDMRIEIIQSDDVLESLDSGSDFFFASNQQLARANANFFSYSSPFYFSSYSHLNQTLNSQKFYNIINDTNVSLMKAMPISAFYDGSSYILSSRGVMFDTVDQYEEKTISTLGDEILTAVLKGLGAQVRVRDQEYLLNNFDKNRDLSAIECLTTQADKLVVEEGLTGIYVCRSFHTARINWLVLSEATRERLAPTKMAVITEAVAYAIAKNDSAVLELEQKGVEYLLSKGATFSALNHNEFCESADEILKAENEYSNLWDWSDHKEIRDLIY